MEELNKFQAEARSILINLKIAVQEFEKNPDSNENQEALLKLLNQLGESSEIYGVNTLMNLTSKAGNLISHVQSNEIEDEDAVVDCLTKAADLTGDMINDPLLADSKLKKEYESLINECETIMKEGVDDAKMASARFHDVFMEEAFDLINQLEEKMLQLESDPDDADMIDNVFRIMHTLKGNSNMFGFTNLAEITHQLENIYDDIRGGKHEMTRNILEITLHCIDHFRNLIDDPEMENENVREHQKEMLAEISSVLEGKDEDDKAEVVKSGNKKRESLSTFYLHFKPEPDVFDDGTNPLYFVSDLHDMGECLPLAKINLSGKDEYAAEKSYTEWHILLAGKADEEEIREHFMFLKEESQPQVKFIAEENLLKDEEFVSAFRKKVDEAGGKPIDISTLQLNKQGKNTNHKASGAKQTSSENISSVRVASQKIDQMMNLISELVTKQAELSMLVADQDNPRLMEVAESIENISRDLRDNAFSVSLIPLEKSVLRFQRLVRDVSNRFNKKVDFVVEGKETELDKTIIEKIIDPIMHILRNSIDHGIETPAERKKKGKPENGTIMLKAYPSGAHVVIEISDDGAGINLDKVKATAIKKGIIQPNETLPDDELLHLIVSPGFSTAENISEVSGRGVGMDVVNQKISEIRGELEINTKKDKGTTITIKLPLTISIIDSLLMKIDSEFYLVPLAVVDRCAEIKAEKIINTQNKYIVLNQEYIPFVDLRNEFEITSERPDIQQALLVKYRDNLVGIIVDEVIGNYQAVLKSLGESYKKQEIISGASILGSGQIALVLDTNKIIQEYTNLNDMRVNAMA